ncbi:MAG: TMEM165/GDT1 family protein [Candidatus Peregrinibacteria bacterium]|nr:TMEM165/GDT1 family protein [Candidatus Peregrinibacteria bacterium]
MEGFLIPFVTILVAELGDKSFLAVTYLSSKTKKHWTVFAGAMSAYIILNSITAFAGSALTNYIDLEILKMVTGGIFIAFGIKALLFKEDESQETLKTTNLFRTTFGLILLSEIGDRTNIGTGLFATQYHPLLVLISVTLALGIITLLAIELGKWLTNRIDHQLIARIGGVVFIVIGALILLT